MSPENLSKYSNVSTVSVYKNQWHLHTTEANKY